MGLYHTPQPERCILCNRVRQSATVGSPADYFTTGQHCNCPVFRDSRGIEAMPIPVGAVVELIYDQVRNPCRVVEREFMGKKHKAIVDAKGNGFGGGLGSVRCLAQTQEKSDAH